MARNVALACRDVPIRALVYLSSVDVYGRSPPLPIDEQTPVAPDSWYGLAKYCSEWILQDAGYLRFPVTVLRIPGVYGLGPYDRSVIGSMIGSLRSDRRLRVHGVGTVLRDYVHVQDLVEVIWRLQDTPRNGTINVCTGHSRSILALAETIRDTVAPDCPIVHDEDQPSRAFDLLFRNAKLRDWIPGVRFRSVEEGIQDYLSEATA
jgi:UDP-glucose 4-epimerase